MEVLMLLDRALVRRPLGSVYVVLASVVKKKKMELEVTLLR